MLHLPNAPNMKYLLLLTYVVSVGLFAQSSAYDPEKSKGQLYEYANYINAAQCNYTIESIAKDSLLQFKDLESDNHSVGFTRDNYWVRFKLQNSSDDANTYYLETARPITDIATLYQITGDDIRQFKSGDQIPFGEKQVEHRSTLFKIILPAKSTQQIFLHFKSDGETINIPLNLYNETSFWVMNYKQQLFLGVFYGLLFLAGIIYLFFYRSLKERSFLYYGCYVFSIALLQAALDGFIHQYIFPEGGFLNSRAVLITALLSNLFLLKYCEHFLKVTTDFIKFKKAFNVIYVVLTVLFIMIFVNQKTLELVYPISNLNGLVSLLLILTTVFVMRYKRIKIDPYFSIGIFFLVIGLLGFVMNNLSLLPNNFYTLNSAKFGAGFEVIFLSLSMTNLIRKLRVEKETSQELALQKSEEISELKTYFMSNISHELRTPINAIMGIAEIQLNDVNSENYKHFEIIKNASLSLLSNVNDILDFEKIEKNELELKQEEFNPSQVLTQITNNWKTEAENKGLKFDFELDNKIPEFVLGDSERFVQIINNILSNSVKFTTTGSVKLKLSCTTQPNSMCRFSFNISDTGIGMNSEMKKHVFSSFNQMRLNHKREFGGIGLGLSIVKHLVELFNGNIIIESKVGEGTQVFIDIPLQVLIKEKTVVFDYNNIKDLNKALNILVVEDNILNQLVMRKLLSGIPSINFKVVNNGLEAINTLKDDVYDLVLMDLQMPVMDGYEATKIIRNGELGEMLRDVAIIAVTADAMQETRKRVLALGMNDYITKPINRDLLLEKINIHYESILKIA